MILHKLVSTVLLIPHKLHDTQHDVCLYIDIRYINGMPLLTTISKNIKYCTAMWVADCMAPTKTVGGPSQPILQALSNMFLKLSTIIVP